MHYFTANSFYKQTCEYSCSKALMSHNINLLSSHFTISRALHSCETVNRKVNCVLHQIKMVTVQIFFLFRLLIKVNENHALMQKIYVLPSCWRCLNTQGTTTCVGRTHIYEKLQLETVCILVRYSNTLTLFQLTRMNL